MLTLIAARARNGAIGKDGTLPWHLPEDLKFFKRETLGGAVIMGRRTWESIGRPLPGRRMIVLTRHPGYAAPGCTVAYSLDEVWALAGAVPESMVIGGASLYAQTLPQATRLYSTVVEANVPGNVWFPEWRRQDWRLEWEETHLADTDHAWPYRFQRWERT